MFVSFFYHLRDRGIPVSTTEFLTLLEALDRGLSLGSLEVFYALGRATLVKRVEHYDLYDGAFLEFFKDRPFTGFDAAEIHDELLQWLQEARHIREISDEEAALLERLNLDELRRLFEERLAEQDERHDGGTKWIGTGGTSPFGHSGKHPAGIRVGGQSKNRSALQVAQDRRFKNLRTDRVLDTRQIALALRKLRRLERRGAADELDLDATIDATARNYGDIDLVFRPPRENQVRLLLLMDVGGSMTPYSELTSRLFSAAHRARYFRRFSSYYFHNCPYETLYTDIYRRKGRPFRDVLAEVDHTWCCLIVGDAAMAPEELMEPGGSISYFHFNQDAGVDWLRRLREKVPRSAWLNPDRPDWWGSYTTRVIQRLFPMFPLTIDGLQDAVSQIR